MFWLLSLSLINSKFIKIKTSGRCEYLPTTAVKSWQIWTYSENILNEVETEGYGGKGWVNPTSFDELYLPSDLPLPKYQPSLGIGVSNGVLRYIMPSTILTLDTPDKSWRNRGITSLPRASSWIDLFGSFSPNYLKKFNLATFGKIASDVRFLEDQDGSAAWQLLNRIEGDKIYTTYYEFAERFNLEPLFEVLKDGFHFIDIPLQSSSIPLPRYEVKSYLSDFEDPKLFLESEDTSMLDTEPCGELHFICKSVASGRGSKYLPDVSNKS
jgi:hypothetical protein